MRRFLQSVGGTIKSRLQSPDRVTLDPEERAAYEKLALQLLREHKHLTLPELAVCVGERMLQAEQLRGGSVLDVALWGSNMYRRHALEAIRGMLGRSLLLERDGPWLLAVPVAAVPADHPADGPHD